jgi:hypothetical protein
VELPRDLEQVEEEAVDPIPDARAVVVRLDVDVGGAVERGPAEHVVDDAHDRRVVGLALELPEVDGALGQLRGRRAHVEPEVDLERVVESLAGDRGVRDLAVRLLDGLLDSARRADAEVDVEPGRPPEIVQRHDVQGIGGGHDQLPARTLGGDDPVLARDLLGHELDDFRVEPGQVLAGDRLLAELRAQVLQQHVLVDQLHVDEDLPQSLAGLALALEGLVELVGGQDLVVDQHLAQRRPRPAILGLGHSPVLRPPISSSRARIIARSGLLAGPFARKAR